MGFLTTCTIHSSLELWFMLRGLVLGLMWLLRRQQHQHKNVHWTKIDRHLSQQPLKMLGSDIMVVSLTTSLLWFPILKPLSMKITHPCQYVPLFRGVKEAIQFYYDEVIICSRGLSIDFQNSFELMILKDRAPSKNQFSHILVC